MTFLYVDVWYSFFMSRTIIGLVCVLMFLVGITSKDQRASTVFNHVASEHHEHVHSHHHPHQHSHQNKSEKKKSRAHDHSQEVSTLTQPMSLLKFIPLVLDTPVQVIFNLPPLYNQKLYLQSYFAAPFRPPIA